MDPALRGPKGAFVPALPVRLTSLRHLVYANTRAFITGLGSVTTLTSLETLAHLSCCALKPYYRVEHGERMQGLLRALPNLVTLYAPYSMVLQLQPVPVHPALRHLETDINLVDVDGTTPFTAQLRTLRALESLRLHNHISVPANESLTVLTTLSCLRHLEHCGPGWQPQITAGLLVQLSLFTALPELKVVAGGKSEWLLLRLPNLQKLSALSLAASAANTGPGALAALAKLTRPGLSSLQLQHCSAQTGSSFKASQSPGSDADDGNAAIRDLSTLTRLTTLTLRNTNMHRGGCAAVGCLVRLRQFRLSCCRLPEPEALRSLTNLEELSIKRCTDINDAWLAALLTVHFRRLRGFCLCGPANWSQDEQRYEYAVGDASAAELSQLPQLEELDLSQTLISDSGLERLAEAPELRCLWLQFCMHVTQAGVRHLACCRRLRCVSVRGTNLGVAVPRQPDTDPAVLWFMPCRGLPAAPGIDALSDWAGPRVRVVGDTSPTLEFFASDAHF